MAAPNFNYENRCIYVSDEDYEYNNIPNCSELIRNGHNYTCLDGYNFNFFDIVLTSGYYEGGCIDYVQRDKDISYWLGYSDYYDTKKQVIADLCSEFNLTKYRANKLCSKLSDFADFGDWYDNMIENVTEYLAEQEEIQVNKAIDQIKKEYGFIELATAWRASNGETGYRIIN